MNFDKNLIAKNFSRGAKTYDEVAQVQFAAARELVELVLPYLKKDSRILDLGSGTSFIAKQLTSSSLKSVGFRGSQESSPRDPRNPMDFKDDEFLRITEVDIALDMLQSWRERPLNVEAIVADFENLSFAKNSFDLILSSFSLQWSSDFARNFTNYFSLLKPGGIFAFCVPTNGSLPEMSDFNINEFPTNKTLKTSLQKAGFKQEFFFDKIVSQNFSNRRDLFKFLKQIGADSPLKTKLPLKKVASKKIGSQLSWKVSHFLCIK